MSNQNTTTRISGSKVSRETVLYRQLLFRRAQAALESARLLEQSSSSHTRPKAPTVAFRTLDTPRARHARGGHRIPQPNRFVEMNICEVLVMFEFFELFNGLEPVKRRHDENVNKQLRRSIYFSGLPDQVSI